MPVPVVRDFPLVFVLEVERVDVEGVYEPPVVLHPHGAAVEVDEEPLVRVEKIV